MGDKCNLTFDLESLRDAWHAARKASLDAVCDKSQDIHLLLRKEREALLAWVRRLNEVIALLVQEQWFGLASFVPHSRSSQEAPDVDGKN